MELSAVIHRPASEMAYLINENVLRVSLRAKHNNIKAIEIFYGDPYDRRLTQNNQEVWTYQTKPMHRQLKGVLTDYWQVDLPVPESRHLEYAFRIKSADDRQYLYDDRRLTTYSEKNRVNIKGFRTPYLNISDVLTIPGWLKQTTWYQVIPDRFAQGKEVSLEELSDQEPSVNSLSGNLQGLVQNLGYIADLGFNGLDLTPIFKAYSNHKYDTIDFFNVDSSLGEKEDLAQLVTKAHEMGIHVMLEATINYLSDASLQWQDVRKNGARSRFASWFRIYEFPVTYSLEADPNYAHQASYAMFANNPHMPMLNLENEEVQAYLLGVLAYWVKEFDIDAWRLSHGDDIPQAFQAKIAKKLRGIRPDIYLLSENVQTSQNHIGQPVFNGAVNYPHMEVIKSYFSEKEESSGEFIAALNAQFLRNRRQTNQGMFNVLDTPRSPRLMSQAHDDPQLLRAILAFNYLQVGTPVVLYGTEQLMAGMEAPNNRQNLSWEEEKQDDVMKRYLRLLNNFRHEYADVLTDGNFEWSQYSNRYNYFSFIRTFGDKKIFVLFNLGIGSIRFQLPKNTKLILSQNLVDNENRLGQYGFVIIESKTNQN